MGLAFSVLLFLYGVTGTALVYEEAYWRVVYPELRGATPALDFADQAAGVAAAAERFGDRVRTVKLPWPELAAYHVYLEEGEAFLTADGFELVDVWGTNERLMSWLFDLHVHLMAGETGERVGGFVALLGVLLALTGLYLWWPTRKRFALRNLLPLGTKRNQLVAWHRDLGLVFTPILLVVLLTGAGLVFYTTATSLLNGLFGDAPPVVEVPAEGAGDAVAWADAGLFARVAEAFPDARVSLYTPPAEARRYHTFRLQGACEIHPNGRTFLYLDGDGSVLARSDACAMPPGQRVLQSMYPLHAGKADNAAYKLATFLCGLVLSLLALSGAWGYAKKLGWVR